MIKICGLDEVGRGAFAGPLVAAAVVIRRDLTSLISNCPVPIRDSKTLSHKQRQSIATYLIHKKIKCLFESISVEEINQKGMGWANKEIFLRLIKKAKATKYVVDGNLKLDLPSLKIESRIKADRKVSQVKLASILAKLYRDKIMRKLHKSFPHYQWQQNKGYGTKAHCDAITLYGPCKHHRLLWLKTLKKALNNN